MRMRLLVLIPVPDDLRFRVSGSRGLRFKISGLVFSLGFRGLGAGVSSSGFRDSGVGVCSLGFRV